MSNLIDSDTIVAIATAAGRGGIGIIRLSGAKAQDIAQKICGQQLSPRLACFSEFLDGSKNLLDQGLALYFKKPKSFTGEDVVELHAHGSPVVLDQLLAQCIAYGARQARAGEFSQRAFLNNKIDLTQAEAIADLISSSSKNSAKSALKSLQGNFSKEINVLVEQLVSLRVYIEAAMDFPEEEVDFLDQGNIIEKLNTLKKQLGSTLNTAQQGVLLTEGMTAVIAGLPNAGKSSLLNALSGRDSAIVTNIAGTTRDTLKEHIQIDGMPLHIIDTAGLRDSEDLIEQEGIKRAKAAIEKADQIIFVIDASAVESKHLTLENIWPKSLGDVPKNIPITVVKNKCDLINEDPNERNKAITLSALSGVGIDLLKNHLKKTMGYQSSESGVFSARRRHLEALNKSVVHIERGVDQLFTQKSSELLAEELRLAQIALEEITGRFTPDDLLDKIFRDFCIGK